MSKEFERAKELSRKLFEKAKQKAETGSFGDSFEDGRYKAVITDAVIGESKNSGRLQIKYVFTFSEGEYKGKNKYAYKGLDKEDNLARALQDIMKLGIEVADFDDIEPALLAIKKKRPVVAITLKTRGEYQDVYIDKALTGEEAEADLGDESSDFVPEELEAEDTLKEGMTVSFTLKGEEVEGTVKEILEDTEEARVEVDGKVYRIKADKLTLVEAKEEAEPAEEPAEEEVPDEPAEESPEPEEEEPKKAVKKVSKPVAKKKKR